MHLHAAISSQRILISCAKSLTVLPGPTMGRDVYELIGLRILRIPDITVGCLYEPAEQYSKTAKPLRNKGGARSTFKNLVLLILPRIFTHHRQFVP